MIDINILWAWARNKFWEIVHNCFAHPLLPFFGSYATRFHDWTVEVWDPAVEPTRDTEIIAINRMLGTQAGRERLARLLAEASEQR